MAAQGPGVSGSPCFRGVREPQCPWAQLKERPKGNPPVEAGLEGNRLLETRLKGNPPPEAGLKEMPKGNPPPEAGLKEMPKGNRQLKAGLEGNRPGRPKPRILPEALNLNRVIVLEPR